MAGWAAVASVGGVSSLRSSARRWIVPLSCALAIFGSPIVAVHLLPAASRQEWYALATPSRRLASAPVSRPGISARPVGHLLMLRSEGSVEVGGGESADRCPIYGVAVQRDVDDGVERTHQQHKRAD